MDIRIGRFCLDILVGKIEHKIHRLLQHQMESHMHREWFCTERDTASWFMYKKFVIYQINVKKQIK